MAEDPAEGYLLLFGGSTGHIVQNGVAYGDTWTYKSGVWTDISPTVCTPASCPTARNYAGMAYYNHSGQEYVVMFGGWSSGHSSLAETWIFNGSWYNVTPTVPDQDHASPPGAQYVSMAWDPLDGYDLLYGGCSVGGCNSSAALSDQTWAFEGLDAAHMAQWVNLTGTVHPPRLYSASLTFDSADEYLVLFGGGSPGVGHATYQNQTWSYTAETGWVNRTEVAINATNTPPYRSLAGGQMAYDPTTGSVVLFGGQHFWASPSAGDKTPNATLNSTWIYKGGTWTNVTPTLPISPHARFGGVMAFDPSDDALVLFGGLSGTMVHAPLLNDTWWFSGTPGAWTNHTAPTYSVRFTETGLPAGTEWRVTIVNVESFSSTTTTLSFNESNGTYTYSASAPGYSGTTGSLTVRGPATAPVLVRFSSSSSAWWDLPILDYVILGAVLVAAAICVTLVLMRRKRKALPAPMASPSQPGEGAPPAPP